MTPEEKAKEVANEFAREYRKASMDNELMHDPELDWLTAAISTALKEAGARARLQEREERAKICDAYAKDAWGHTAEENAAEKLATAIRSRS